MCRAEGMGIAPWGSLGGGKFKSEEQRNAQEGRRVEASDQEVRTSRVLESIANRKNTLITSVALAYVMHKTSYVFPIIGGRKVDHLKANIMALTLQLTQEDIQEIDNSSRFDPGFPHDFLYRGGQSTGGPDVWLLQMGGTIDHVQPSKVSSFAITSSYLLTNSSLSLPRNGANRVPVSMRIFGDGCQLGIGRSIIHNGKNWVGRKE